MNDKEALDKLKNIIANSEKVDLVKFLKRLSDSIVSKIEDD